jgi:hypothetical protein
MRFISRALLNSRHGGRRHHTDARETRGNRKESPWTAATRPRSKARSASGQRWRVRGSRGGPCTAISTARRSPTHTGKRPGQGSGEGQGGRQSHDPLAGRGCRAGALCCSRSARHLKPFSCIPAASWATQERGSGSDSLPLGAWWAAGSLWDRARPAARSVASPPRYLVGAR